MIIRGQYTYTILSAVLAYFILTLVTLMTCARIERDLMSISDRLDLLLNESTHELL